MRLRLIAFAVSFALLPISASAQPVIRAVPEQPKIIVDGYGEVKTMPDLATIGYTVRGEGSTSDAAVRAMTNAGAGIEAALRSIDGAAEPRTGNVEVTPVKSDDCKEEENGTPQLSSGPCAVLGYVAEQTVTVQTADVKDAGTMVGLVGRGGGYGARINSFELRDPRAAQRQAMAAALANAASKAAAIATASRISLGPIVTITTIDRMALGEMIVAGSRQVGIVSNAAAPPIPVTVNPKPITTGANVTVTYAIGR